MHLADFDFDLPRDLIADRPAEPRDSARLLMVPAAAEVADRHIADLPQLLRPGDLLVFNDTKVIPARLVGRRRQAMVEITLARDLGGGVWRSYAKGARRLHAGDRIEFAEDLAAEVLGKSPDGEVTLRFDREGTAFRDALARHGAMPLPPYIKRPRGGISRDRADYQTMFAKEDGAVAAPTAGLHFTSALLDALAVRGVGWVTVTLHVGPGTFLPVKADDPRDHRMHAEWGVVSAEAAQRINVARQRGGRIVAVGTTSLRLLESAAADTGQIRLLLSRCRFAADQFSSAEIDPPHAGCRAGRPRPHQGRLRARRRGALPLLLVRRRLPDRAVAGGEPPRPALTVPTRASARGK
jgi:S-adenosylmethionine:tRNA ribosyltransferase-isomerase